MNVSAAAFNMPDDSHGMWSRGRALHNDNSRRSEIAATVAGKFNNRLLVCQDDPANQLLQNQFSQDPIQSSQLKSPSSPTEDGADMTSTSKGTNTDLLLGTRERVPSRRDARDLIKLAFINALPKHRVTAKEIADEIGAAENTVEGWRGEGVMSAEFLMIVQVKYPQFEGELRRLFKLQRELSPAFAKEFAAFLQRAL